MKTWVKLLITGAAAFAGGFSLGYLVRKKTAEVEIEEITEEELDKLTAEMEGKQNETSNKTDKPDMGVVAQEEKEAYFRRWKENPADIYDTRTKEPVKDPVTTEDVEQIEEYLSNLEGIEAGTMADWLHWMSRPDGEYDAVELRWYDADGIICDDKEEPLENSDKFMGFDIQEEWDLADPDTTGDPDIRVIFNHKTKTIYHITRVHSSYSAMKRMEEFGEDGYDDEDERSLL